MADRHIRADQTGTGQRGGDVTGTPRPNGKFGLDQTSRSELLAIAEHLIKGTQPSVNYDEIVASTAADGTITFTYKYDDAVQMRIQIATPYGDFTATFLGDRLLISSGGDAILIDSSGDHLIL